MRKLIIILLSLLGTPVLTMASQTATQLIGVWTGNIGKQSITACFNKEYHLGTGNYYYQRYLVPITLESVDVKSGDAGETWKEDNGEWQLDNIAPDLIQGIWSSSDKTRKLPIKLTRIREFNGAPVASSDACGSDAYNKAIEMPPKLLAGKARSVHGIGYREIAINLSGPEIDDRQDQGLHMATVELLGNIPSFSAVNKSLHKLISTSKLFECRRAQLAWNGMEGLLTQTVNGVSVVSGHWLNLSLANQGYCAGAHLDMWDASYTFNLDTGEQENLFSWFQGGESKELDAHVGSHGQLPAHLAEFISSKIGNDHGNSRNHLSRQEFKHCYGDPVFFSYQLSLFDGGIDFNIPTTRNGSCGDNYRITFKELAPFLNKKGRAAVAQIRITATVY